MATSSCRRRLPSADLNVTQMGNDELLTEQQLAQWLGLTPDTVNKIRRRGEGPQFLRPGKRQIRYRVGDVRRWLARRRTKV